MKMNFRHIMTIIFLLPALSLVSCNDFLDREDDDNITEAEAFSRYEKVNEMVSDVYAAAKRADRPLVFFVGQRQYVFLVLFI